MPALFALGQRAALQAVQRRLRPDEMLLAYLDDIYAVATPDRVRPIYDLLAHELYTHSHIQLNSGKTRVWNTSGNQPPHLEPLGQDVWVGNNALPPQARGLTVLGAPIGSNEFIQAQLRTALEQHQHLLQRLPELEDVQSSWLLLLYCASPRCTYLLRMCNPTHTQDFATEHDTAVAATLQQLLQLGDVPATSLAIAHLPLSSGGLGLTSASILASSAHWASWADSFPILQQQLPNLTAQILPQLQRAEGAPPAIHAALQAAAALTTTEWTPPNWTDLLDGARPSTELAQEDPQPHHRGWQQTAVTQVHRRFRTELQATLDPAGQAMLESQSGPFASRVFTTVPYTADFTYPSRLFRVLLLRRLRLPLPLTARACRCRRALDPLGDHRAACPRSGALRSRGTPLERAAARVRREAGARVTTHTLLSDLNIPTVHRIDNRRIEVIANGLPLWGGSQLAIDTTIVSPLTSQAAPRQHRGQYAGTALRDARRSKERTCPELVQPGRCRLVVFGVETGGRWSAEAAGFLRQLAHARARQSPEPLRQAVTAALIARWSALLAHATFTALAASLLCEDTSSHNNVDGFLPPRSEFLAHMPREPTAPSRIPAPS